MLCLFSTYFINDNPTFINRNIILLRNPPDCTILNNWVLDNFTSADELLAKVLQSFETCLPIGGKFYGNMVLSLKSTIIFDDRSKVTQVAFFIADFNVLSCELESFAFTLFYWAILFWYYIKRK